MNIPDETTLPRDPKHIAKWLTARGFGGLYNPTPGAECGCAGADLVTCDIVRPEECRAGYVHPPSPCDRDVGYIVCDQKDCDGCGYEDEERERP